MKIRLMFGLALAAAALFSLTSVRADDTAKDNKNSGDDFMRRAAQDNTAEIEMAKLALQRSQNQDVRRLAERILKDHQNAEKKLIEMKKGASIEVKLNDEQQKEFKRLSALQGQQFDREYVRHQMDDHKKAIDQFKKEADNKDSKWAKYASDVLPNLQEHLKLAQQANDRLGKGGAQPTAVPQGRLQTNPR